MSIEHPEFPREQLHIHRAAAALETMQETERANAGRAGVGGSMRMTERELPLLREYFLRGGTAMMDDFHGPYEWDAFAREMKRLFPDREIVEVPRDHPVFEAFYKIDGYPQVAGLGSFLQGRTWERGGVLPHLRTILDDAGRPMMFINWNTDMGDGWEWSNAEDYPGYIRYTSLAYRMGINEIVYTLTH